jgi:hypothetical protein
MTKLDGGMRETGSTADGLGKGGYLMVMGITMRAA